MFTENALKLCEHAVSTYIDTVFPGHPMSSQDRQILIRFIKCQLFGMCIDWINRGMTDAAYDDLRRMLELMQGVPELIIQRGHETADN